MNNKSDIQNSNTQGHMMNYVSHNQEKNNKHQADNNDQKYTWS